MNTNNNYSKEHLEYIEKNRKYAQSIKFFRILIIVAFFLLWELLTKFNILDAFIFSSPSRIVNTIITLFNEKVLFMHIGVTLFETVVGFVLSTLLGTIIAIMLWWFPKVSKILDPYLVILNALPKIVLGPILIVWIGAGIKTVITITVLVSIVVTITSVLDGFNEISNEQFFLMRSLGATKKQTLTYVVLPASIPNIVTALKLNVGMSWVGAIVGEFLISRAGLGYLAVYGGQVFKLDLVMTGVLILCALAAAMYYFVCWFEKQLLRQR